MMAIWTAFPLGCPDSPFSAKNPPVGARRLALDAVYVIQ